MAFWVRFQTWWRTKLPKWAHMPASWVAHGVVTWVIMAPYIAFGHPWTGFWSAVTAYLMHEADDIVEYGPRWIDNVGDILGPVVFGLGLIWLL